MILIFVPPEFVIEDTVVQHNNYTKNLAVIW